MTFPILLLTRNEQHEVLKRKNYTTAINSLITERDLPQLQLVALGYFSKVLKVQLLTSTEIVSRYHKIINRKFDVKKNADFLEVACKNLLLILSTRKAK